MYALSDSPIDPQRLYDAVLSDTFGAVVMFTGVVRRLSDDLQPVTGLHYEAHEAMAIAEFEAIAQEARRIFGACEIAAVHRTGNLKVGDVAVAVAVASPHRAQAFDACRFVIDQIKARAPIWKKEYYDGGGSAWRENDCQSPAH